MKRALERIGLLLLGGLLAIAGERLLPDPGDHDPSVPTPDEEEA